MNMQISPASTHSQHPREPLADMIVYKVVCDIRNTSDFKPQFWDCLSLQKILSNGVDLWNFTWFVFKH